MGPGIVNAIVNDKHRYPVLDSLRGVAALGVLVTHSLQLTVADGVLNHTPLRIFVNGRCFVIFFFILSGFVLSTAIWNSSGKTGYGTYVARRLLRLYPPYAVAGLIAVLLIWLSGRDWSPWQPVEYALTLGTTTGIAINPPSWSLVYEIRLSLVMPLFCLLIGRNFKTFAWATAILFCLVEVLVLALKLGQFPYAVDDLAAAVIVTLRYAVCFAIGAMLARCNMQKAPFFAVVAKHPYVAGLLAYLLMSVLLDQTSILGATIIIVLSLRSPSLQRVMSFAPFVWLGRISYSLYLTHVVVLSFIAHLVGDRASPIVAVAIALPLALIVAEIFYRLVEAPTITLSRRVGRRTAETAQSSAGTPAVLGKQG